jgi:hypothetical protein
VAIAASPLHGRRKCEIVDRPEYFFERDADFEASEVRAEAEVGAVPERQMWIGVAL